MQISVTENGKTTEIITVVTPEPGRPFATYTDPNGHRLAVFTADIPELGPGVNIVTGPHGCMIQVDAAPTFVRELHAAGRAAAGGDDAGPVDIGEPEPGPYSVLTERIFMDVDQDIVAVYQAAMPEAGPAVHIVTSPAGCSIPVADLASFGIQVLTVAAAAKELVQ